MYLLRLCTTGARETALTRAPLVCKDEDLPGQPRDDTQSKDAGHLTSLGGEYMFSLEQQIRQLLTAGERDVDGNTRAVLKHILSQKNAAELLFPVVRAYVSSATRSFVATAEREWDAAEKDLASAERRGDHRSEYQNEATKARTKISVETFYVPGEGNVAWGQATVLQHKSAIAHSEKYIAGYQADIDRHTLAIKKIERASVTCLDEIK